jgi:hypothetical protein
MNRLHLKENLVFDIPREDEHEVWLSFKDLLRRFDWDANAGYQAALFMRAAIYRIR